MSDREQIKEYLYHLFDICQDGYIEIRPILDGDVEAKFFPVNSSSRAADYIESVAGRLHAFAGVCPRSRKDGKSESIKTLNAIWADLDVKDFRGGKSSVLSSLKENAPLPPSLIVDSGNGYHAYWLLDKPFTLNEDRGSAKELLVRYHRATHADATHDFARILRVPGTPNIKNPDDPIPCRIEECSGERYSISELAEQVKDQNGVDFQMLREKLPARVLQRAKDIPERFEDDRSGNDFYIAKKLAQHDFSDEQIKSAFQLFSDRGWDAGDKYSERGDDYIDYILKDAGKTGRKRLNNLIDVIEDSDGIPSEEMSEACEIISNLPPVEKDVMQKELQEAMGGQRSVSIKAIRKQVEVAGGVSTPETASGAGRMAMNEKDYLNIEGELYVYENGYYQDHGEEVIREQLQRILDDQWTRNKRDNALEWVKDRTYTKIKNLPDNRGKINVRNGVIDIEEGRIRDHDPEDRFLYRINAEYDPDVVSPKLDEFVSDIFYEEDIPVAWEHCGYTLLPWFNLKKFLILIGTGNNGKSVFLSLLERVLGKDSISHETLRQLTRNKFSSAELHGKLANICADISADKIQHVEVLKELTGGDTVRAEVKFGSVFEFQNTAKLLFSANRLPRVGEISEAYFNRLHIIRCPNTFGPDEADPNLIEKLSTENVQSAWLNRALEGAARLLRRNQFTITEHMKEEKTQYRLSVDSVSEFLQESCGDSGVERQSVLYKAYKDWCSEKGRQPVSSIVFRERARIQPNDLQSDTITRDGKTIKVWKGVSLTQG